ncbi:uncharacterized protein LOC129742089 [Uranotaenia lowii]|uniref:uncharacterized protein LOC129742089 n=1 Tax=Uranotaenia lowii TaxID=190385 RepID=UPI0024786406|nr:uncharacterized protein LOC129742089 [Uranotaenia lowii]
MIERHYMDDYLESFDSPEEAIERALEVKLVHAKAGFEIHSWSSNSTEVLEAVGEKDPSAVKKIDAGDSTQTERILGMLWLRKEDAFTYSSNLGHVPEWPTKREVLRVVMSLYDPLGLLSHFTIHGRVLIQDVWRSKKAWDEKVPEELQIRWLQWVSLFNQLNLIRIPRQYFPSRNTAEIGLLQLHVFVDASESAYACAAYLRSEFHDKVSCVLVTAKSRVAPLKTVSIPRLELQAAVVGSRLMEYVEQTCSLNISRRIAWTDSQTVLAWINSDVRKYNQYVSCRVGEILEKTNASDWRWVSSKLNVADEATKWGSGPDLSSGSRWWSGPSFLYDVEEKWPTQRPKHTDPNTELKMRKPEIITVHHVTHGNLLDIKWERFSQWNRLVHALGYVHRYFNIVLCKAKKLTNPNIIFGRDEYLAAERLIFRTVQKETYPEEIRVLVQSSPKDDRTLKRNSPLAKLSPFLDEHGIMRMETRISAAAFLSYETRNPIILPRDHRSTKLLVLWYHAKYFHQNNDTVINEVRQKFHVPRLRSLLRQVQKECMHCNVYKIKAVVPRMSPLPTARLGAFFRPFSFVGLDYFGPLTVKIGRSTVKRWVALYTCLTIRAIHLEVVHSLTTISCKMAMRRFVARRGSPIEVYTDNGTNFWGARNDLIEECKQINTELAYIFTNSSTKWYFNPPSAPHMGGVWERMVRKLPEMTITITDILSISFGTARRTKWFEETKPLEEQDLVVVIDETIRNGWVRGRVLKVIKGSDGRIRRAVIQTSTGTITRPTAKIALLNLTNSKAPDNHLPYGGEDITATMADPK